MKSQKGDKIISDIELVSWKWSRDFGEKVIY